MPVELAEKEGEGKPGRRESRGRTEKAQRVLKHAMFREREKKKRRYGIEGGLVSYRRQREKKAMHTEDRRRRHTQKV